jgi:urease accessory protein
VRVRLGDGGGRPRLDSDFHAGSAKLRFPLAPPGAVEAMVLNTSGGLTGDDTFTVDAGAHAHTLTLTTQACERVYRSEGPPARVTQHLAVGAGARLRHLPQPTILFDGANLDRRTRVALAGEGTATVCEALVLGREAMGETVRRLTVHDRLEVWIDGRLAFVDAFRLDTAALSRVRTPAGLGQGRGIGILLHRSGPLHASLEGARAALDGVDVLGGASLVHGLVVVRVLAPSHTALQDALAQVATALDGMPPPRAWRL